ncbi:MAG: hypothetical protein Fur002_08210 [Anaerolineales bacterium]
MNKPNFGEALEDGDYALVLPQADANDKDIVVAQYQDPRSAEYFVMAKRYHKGEKKLTSETSESGAGYEEIDMLKAGAEIKGVVVAIAKPRKP